MTSCAHQFLSIIVLMATKEMYNNLKPEDRHRMSLLYYYSTSIPPLSLHFTVLSLPLFGNHLKIWGKVLVFTSTDAAALMKSWRSYVSNFRKISNLQLASFSRNVFILFYFGFFFKAEAWKYNSEFRDFFLFLAIYQTFRYLSDWGPSGKSAVSTHVSI